MSPLSHGGQSKKGGGEGSVQEFSPNPLFLPLSLLTSVLYRPCRAWRTSSIGYVKDSRPRSGVLAVAAGCSDSQWIHALEGSLNAQSGHQGDLQFHSHRHPYILQSTSYNSAMPERTKRNLIQQKKKLVNSYCWCISLFRDVLTHSLYSTGNLLGIWMLIRCDKYFFHLVAETLLKTPGKLKTGAQRHRSWLF